MEKRSARHRRTAGLLVGASIAVAASAAAAQENKTPWVLDAFAGAAHDNADSAGAAPLMPTLHGFSDALGQRIMAPSAASPYRTEFDGGLGDRDKPWINSRALVPLAQDGIDTMLVQGNVAHAWSGPDARPDGGLGMGYRRLLGDGDWLAGANAFVDDGWSDSKARGSFGGELRAAPFDAAVNYYHPYGTGDMAGIRQSAAAGYDYDLRLQVPYIPSASVTAGGGTWTASPALGLMETKRLGMSFQPLPYLAFDGRVNRNADAAAAYSVGLRVTLPLGGKPRAPTPNLIDDRAYRGSGMAQRALDIIRRDETIPVAPTEGG